MMMTILKDLSEIGSSDLWSFLRTELATKENGYWVHKFVKAEVFKSGQMVRCMKATGKTTKRTEKED